MPKSYSEQEREYIQTRLKEEAAKCLAQYGVRRTTVDEIVQRVNIPKGTFYLFYKSKELLLFDVIQEQHDLIEQKLFEDINSIDYSIDLSAQIVEIAFSFFKIASESPVLGILNSDEFEVLKRKLPPEILKQHLAHDTSIIENLLGRLIKKENRGDIETISAAFHAIYYATLHKEEIGSEYFDNALYLLVKGLIFQIL